MLVFIISIFSGIISGMGIGGGTILIPALTILFNTEQHIAQSVNLLSFIPTAAAALIMHIRNKNVEFSLLLKLITGGVAGAIGGAVLASLTTPSMLRKLFAGFLFLMGAYEICCKKK